MRVTVRVSSVTMFYGESGPSQSIISRCVGIGPSADVPWNKNSPMMLLANPKDPTMTTNLGFEISLTLKNLSMASMKIEKHRASKKTPLTSAPSTSDLCHP